MKKYGEFLDELEGMTCEELLQYIRDLYQKHGQEKRGCILDSAYRNSEETMSWLVGCMDTAEQKIKDNLRLYYDALNYDEDPEGYMKRYEAAERKRKREEEKEMKALYKGLLKKRV